jgi:hypothetical protein
MTQKQITGIVLVTISVGALVFLYKGFFKPKQEVEAEFQELKSMVQVKPQTTTK